MLPALLFGAWRLVKHGFYNADGTYQSTGTAVSGQLVYSPDGAMSVFITKVSDPKSLADVIAYAGKFSIGAGQILHHIDYALWPERVGTIEKRVCDLQGDILTLRTEPNERGFYEIIWQKRVNHAAVS